MGLNVFFCLIIFTFGLTVGSFLNCLIYRLEKREGFLRGRSYCPYCKKTLAWQDLIPLLSFIALKGRCRYCQQKISPQYPLVEIATAIIFFLIYLLFSTNSTNYTMVYFVLISCFLVIVFVYDLKHYIIPDKVIYPAIVIAGIFNFQFLISKQFLIFNYSILTAILAAAFFMAIVLVSRGQWMGVGDIKLAFLMGLFLGWPNILVALFLAFLFGAIIGIGLIITGKKTLKSEVPFGPFLVIGTFLALFLGEKMINWYLGLFL